MPEIYNDNPRTFSKYEGEKNPNKKYLKLAQKITDNVETKLKITSSSPEYWGLREMLTEEEVDVALRMKLRKFYTFEELCKLQAKQFEPAKLQELLDSMAVKGIIEYDYGDHYNDDGPIPDAPKIKRYRISFFVPGSAELFNSSLDRIEAHPPVARFFERMTFLPLEHITSMVPPGGDGIGMHVIPVEKAIDAKQESSKLEHISYWLKKYEGHISAGICSCRASRAMLEDGCEDDVNDWCVQLGDMADYTVETGRAHYITKERALEIMQASEDNGFVHQTTNIDGEDHIFDICNCDVKICNALRTALLYNTPNMERSAYTAHVTAENCVACGRCVEFCPAGALKLGQKICSKDGPIEYPKQPLPDKIHWGKYGSREYPPDRHRPLQSRLPRPRPSSGLFEDGQGRPLRRSPRPHQAGKPLPRRLRPRLQ